MYSELTIETKTYVIIYTNQNIANFCRIIINADKYCTFADYYIFYVMYIEFEQNMANVRNNCFFIYVYPRFV